jgi:hypothetical protein
MKRSLQLLLASILATGFASSASARTTSVSDGHSIPFSDISCYTTNNTIVSNSTCASGTRIWEVALPVDSAGSKTVSILEQNPSTFGALRCAVTVFDALGNFMASGPGFTNFPAFQTALVDSFVGTVTVPSGGHMVVGCVIPVNGRIGRVNWTP